MGKYHWECRNCGVLLTERDLNNHLQCPRCGSENLGPVQQVEMDLEGATVE